MLKERLDEIFQKELILDLIPEIIDLQEQLKKEKDFKNYYLCSSKIIEIYIANEKLDAALEMALELFSKISLLTYPDIYKSLIDNIIYIYITKQYYQQAHTFCLMKKEYLDVNNKEEVNRWYLELAYINEAIDKTQDALLNLTSIIHNDPTDEIKAVALSNIVKLFIDANNLIEAKAFLINCITLVKEINDESGIRYCEYLNGLILHKENNLKEAKKVFSNLFKGSINSREDLTYINEYILVLIDNNDIKEAFMLCEKYYKLFEQSDDLHNKSLFYRNCLKIDLVCDNSLKRKKKNIDNSNALLDKMNQIELLINSNKDIKNLEMKEEELSFQQNNLEKDFYTKLIRSLDDIKQNNSDLNIRTLLMNYSDSMNLKVLFDEVHFLILNKQKSQIIPDIPSNNNNFTTFTYKNKKLYERVIPFNNIIGTFVEKVLMGEDEVIYSLDNSLEEIINPINLSAYNTNFKYLYAVSMKNNDNVFGLCIYLSNNYNILNSYSQTIMNISTKLIAYSLNDLFIKTNNLIQYNLLETCNKNTNSGIFYYNVIENSYILSKEAMKILGVNDGNISLDEYLKHINKNDFESYLLRKKFIDESNDYEITFHNDSNKLIKENGYPYFTANEKYYCGRISEVVIDNDVIKEIEKNKLLGLSDLLPRLDLLKKDDLKILAVKSNIDLFSKFKSLIDEYIYYINNTYIIISNKIKLHEAKKIIKKLLNEYENTISCTILEYPTSLVRLDDLIGLLDHMLDKSGYQEFTNVVYASYISQTTISNCVDKGVMNNNINISSKPLYFNNQLIGEYVYPNINGIYKTDSLNVISNSKAFELDKYVLNKLSSSKLYLYKIRTKSLVKLLENELVTHKIIFDINDFDCDKGLNDINFILKSLSKTSSKLIISNNYVKMISIDNLIKYSSVLAGFNEKIDDELFELIKKYNDEVYYYCNNGFNVGNN